MALTADQAARIAPLALVAVVLAGAFAAVAYLLPADRAQVREFIPQTPDAGAEEIELESGWPESDWTALAPTLVSINHLAAPEEDREDQDEPESPNPPENETQQNDDDTIPVVTGDFAMLGAITAGERVAALVEMSGSQRFVQPGDSLGDYEVVRVAIDHVVLSRNGRQEKLELQPAEEQSLRADQRYLRDRDRLQQAQEERMRALRERRAEQRNDVDR
jgi:hypothetical protein